MGSQVRLAIGASVALCRGRGSRRCACCRPDPRQHASAPRSRLRGRAAALVDADLAPGPDDHGKGRRGVVPFPPQRLRRSRAIRPPPGRRPRHCVRSVHRDDTRIDRHARFPNGRVGRAPCDARPPSEPGRARFRAPGSSKPFRLVGGQKCRAAAVAAADVYEAGSSSSDVAPSRVMTSATVLRVVASHGSHSCGVRGWSSLGSSASPQIGH